MVFPQFYVKKQNSVFGFQEKKVGPLYIGELCNICESEMLKSNFFSKNKNTLLEYIYNSMQCCPRGSRQHCTRKDPEDPEECCLTTYRTTLHTSKTFAMLSERLQTTLHKRKSCAMFS